MTARLVKPRRLLQVVTSQSLHLRQGHAEWLWAMLTLVSAHDSATVDAALFDCTALFCLQPHRSARLALAIATSPLA